VFPLADAREAFERSIGDPRGKIVLRVADGDDLDSGTRGGY
jgi:hypothetical protein